MENNNLDEKEPNKSGKTKTIVLVMILLILMLGIGIFVGMYISKDGNTVENKTQENINGDSNKQSNDIAKDENDVNEVNTTGNNSTTDDESKTENTISNKTEETDKTENTISNKTEEKDNSEENKTDDYKLNVNGSYKYEEQTDNYYHRSDIVITNQTDTSINFSINAAHGNDVDHVNVGDVSGIAKKIDIPTDYIYPESEQIAYQYTENIDGNVNKITLVCTAHRMFQYIQVIEEYPSGVNPYAGNRVFFSGEYDKVN